MARTPISPGGGSGCGKKVEGGNAVSNDVKQPATPGKTK